MNGILRGREALKAAQENLAPVFCYWISRNFFGDENPHWTKFTPYDEELSDYINDKNEDLTWLWTIIIPGYLEEHERRTLKAAIGDFLQGYSTNELEIVEQVKDLNIIHCEMALKRLAKRGILETDELNCPNYYPSGDFKKHIERLRKKPKDRLSFY